MKSLSFRWLTLCLAFLVKPVAADIYIAGHADLGVGFSNDQLLLHLHAEDSLGLYGGRLAPAGEYLPSELLIGVPDPSIARPVGSQWNFLAANSGNRVWFLPQSSDRDKPFLGIGTEDLLLSAGWTTPLSWTFNSITTVAGDVSEFALWQNDSLGSPQVFASSLIPTGSSNRWTQAPFSHDHFNFGFTGEGIYDVSFTISGVNSGSGSIVAGTYEDTASFRFVTGMPCIPYPNRVRLGSRHLARSPAFSIAGVSRKLP